MKKLFGLIAVLLLSAKVMAAQPSEHQVIAEKIIAAFEKNGVKIAALYDLDNFCDQPHETHDTIAVCKVEQLVKGPEEGVMQGIEGFRVVTVVVYEDRESESAPAEYIVDTSVDFEK